MGHFRIAQYNRLTDSTQRRRSRLTDSSLADNRFERVREISIPSLGWSAGFAAKRLLLKAAYARLIHTRVG